MQPQAHCSKQAPIPKNFAQILGSSAPTGARGTEAEEARRKKARLNGSRSWETRVVPVQVEQYRYEHVDADPTGEQV